MKKENQSRNTNEQVAFATSKLNACKIEEEEGSLLTHLFYLNMLKKNLFLNEGC